MQLCPCGYCGSLKRTCRCGPLQVQRYRQRISGPLLDRIDLHVEVPGIEYSDLAGVEAGEASETIRARVEHARQVQAGAAKGAELAFEAAADQDVLQVGRGWGGAFCAWR